MPVVLTTAGEGFSKLANEITNLKKGLKACERAVAATKEMQSIPDRARRAMTSLAEKQELGDHVLMRAEYAQKFRKTTDRQPLDATRLGTLTDEVRQAVSDISMAGIVLKHELKARAHGA